MSDTSLALLEALWNPDHDTRVPPPPVKAEPPGEPGGGGSPWGWRETLAVAALVVAGPVGWAIGWLI